MVVLTICTWSEKEFDTAPSPLLVSFQFTVRLLPDNKPVDGLTESPVTSRSGCGGNTGTLTAEMLFA